MDIRVLRCMGVLALLAGGVAGCASTGPEVTAEPAPDTAAIVVAVRAAGEAADDELDVRPLRDPNVEDLRHRASQYEAQGRHADAAAALDEALGFNPVDPAVLQERAEAALLLGDLDAALAHAQRAIAQGAGVGPLCRRHWATVEEIAKVRAGRGDSTQAQAELDAARRAREACTVAPPPRY